MEKLKSMVDTEKQIAYGRSSAGEDCGDGWYFVVM